MNNIKKIKIHKLFGLYNAEIDLSKRCIIFIGENGSGKTTILKILDCISRKDDIELMKYNFDKIEIIFDTNEFYCVNYDDLFPKNYIVDGIKYQEKEDFKKKIYGKLYKLIEKKYSYDTYTLIKIDTELARLIEALERKKLFNRYIANTYHDIDYGYEINTILKNYNNEPKKFFQEAIKLSINEILLETGPEIKFLGNSIRNTIISRSYIELKDHWPFNLKFYYFDMTKKYNFKDKLKTESSRTEKDLNLFMKYEKERCKNVEFWFHQRIPADDFIKVNSSIMIDKLYKQRYSLLKKIYKEIKTIKNTSINNKDLLNKDNIDINGIINHYYYEEEFVNQINKKAIKYYSGLIGKHAKKSKLSQEEINKFYNDETIYNYENYIRPIMIKDSVFDLENLKIIQQQELEKTQELPKVYTELDECFKVFYEEVIEKILKYKTSKIKILQMLLDKYIVNKKCKIVPAGLIVTKTNIIQKNKKEFKIFESSQTIGISLLSSGEKKLILIFMTCLFSEDETVIIDEPELSLSVIWQEQLLPDILKYTKVKQIIIATHSPAIIKEKQLMKNLVLLPLED